MTFVLLGPLGGCVWAYLSMISSSTTVGNSVLLLVLRGSAMGWAMFEAFRYAAMLRRRMALGLAQPMMTHRFWLWGVGAAAQFSVIVIDTMMWLGTGGGLDGSSAGIEVTAALGLVGAVAVALAFFPPISYVGFIEKRAAQPAV